MADVQKPPTRAQLESFLDKDQQAVRAFDELFKVIGLKPGMVIYSGAQSVQGAVLANGQAIPRLTNPALLKEIVPVSLVTISHASPGVVAWVGNRLAANCSLYFKGGTLPAPLVIGTEYFVKTAGTNSFTVSATAGGAVINTTTDGTGSHEVTAYPHGRGDGSTTFNVPSFPAVGASNAFVITGN